MFQIYSIPNYSIANKNFINNNFISFNDVYLLSNELSNNNNYYHLRIHDNSQYIFFGDLDGFDDIHRFINLLIDFLKCKYNLELDINDISYTKSNIKLNSYHYSIPKWNLSTKHLKDIHKNFIDFLTDDNDKKSIDTSIYSEKFFRYPNQSKGQIYNKPIDNNIHYIINGNMIDFIVEYISDFSVNINEYLDNYFNSTLNINQSSSSSHNNERLVVTNLENNTELNSASSSTLNISDKHINNKIIIPMCSSTFYKQLFDECFSQKRFDNYIFWCPIGMGLKNIFIYDTALHLFHYFSLKSSNSDSFDSIKHKFDSYKNLGPDGIYIGTIFKYACEDNKSKFIQLLNVYSFDLEQSDISKYIHIFAGNIFLYQRKYSSDNSAVYTLYCFNGNFWVNDKVLLKLFISTDLYDFLKSLLIDVYWNTSHFNSYKNKLDNLKKNKYKDDVVESYKEFGAIDIDFDTNWHLFGFNNIVYDLKLNQFRNYEREDFISITTGFNWRSPTSSELKTVSHILNKILTDPDILTFYLQILSTAFEGRCFEKFILANGSGRNGKGVLGELLTASFGNFCYTGKSSFLFETPKSGGCPELANLHLKRLCILREPPEDKKIKNSVMKELTGGGKFNARNLYDNHCEKINHLTLILECNTRPLLDEQPNAAELHRIIDIQFKSTFTSNPSEINEANHIYPADPILKTDEWVQQHKFAFLQILFDHYSIYVNNNYILHFPDSILNRTEDYLKNSDDIYNWFTENYEFTHNNKDIIKIKDIYNHFKISDYFLNLTKLQKKDLNYKNFIDKLDRNIFIKKYINHTYNDVKIITNLKSITNHNILINID